MTEGSRNLQPHQERVVEELNQLREKEGKLSEFIRNNSTFTTLPTDEQERLRRQLEVMTEYASILKERIDNFPRQGKTVHA